jgi:hypothetical protein
MDIRDVVDQQGRRIYRAARGLGFSPTGAEDLAQEVFLTFLETLESSSRSPDHEDPSQHSHQCHAHAPCIMRQARRLLRLLLVWGAALFFGRCPQFRSC